MKVVSHILLFSVFAMSSFQCIGPGYHGYMRNGHMNFYGGPIMGIVWIILLVVAGVFFYQYMVKNRQGFGDTPLDILKKRYASGEITRQQFEEMKKNL